MPHRNVWDIPLLLLGLLVAYLFRSLGFSRSQIAAELCIAFAAGSYLIRRQRRG